MSPWGSKVKKRELSWTGRFGGTWLQTYVYLRLKMEEERTVLDMTVWRNMDAELCLPGAQR
jgi:hypothetical protein